MTFAGIDDVLIRECGLNYESTILVGVSGGPDSLCLLSLLHEKGFRVVAAHVNHHLRPEADIEEKQVENFCKERKVPILLFAVDVKGFSETEKLSIEESARILRYRCLMKAAKENSAQALAVAHQADDQIETMLMHVLRGSGMSGLKAMSYRSFNANFSSEIPIVRPLLGVWREEIEDYCREHEITPSYDQSNDDKTYFRNRIRHELVPLLKTYNTQADRHLWQLSQLAGDEEDLVNNLTQQALNKLVKETGEGYFVISRESFTGNEIALQRRIGRQLLAVLCSNLRDIGLEPVQTLCDFMNSPAVKGEWQILDGVRVTHFTLLEDLLFTDNADLSALWPLISTEIEIDLSGKGEVLLNPNWLMKFSVVRNENNVIDAGSNAAFFDLDQVTRPLKINCWKNGGTFQPFGMKGKNVKIGDFFTNNHLPELARSQWPILYGGNSVLWIAGLRRANSAPVTANTRQVLKIELVRTEKKNPSV